MERGDLVPDEVMVGLIAERVASGEAADGFILDGFPRTIAQAEALDEKLTELDRGLTTVLLIDVPDDEVVRRLSGRRVCPNGHVFHMEFDPPKEEDVCDVCGEELAIRDDDKPDVVRHRLGTYHEKTEPLVAHYEERGILSRVDGKQAPDEVTSQISALLATLRMEEEL
jgi:adenylate kinase